MWGDMAVTMNLESTTCQLVLVCLCSLFLFGCANFNSENAERIEVTRLDQSPEITSQVTSTITSPPITATVGTVCDNYEDDSDKYGAIVDVAVSPDEQMVAVGSTVSVQLYRLPSLEMIKEINNADVTIDWSTDSQQLLLWSGRYEGWDLSIVDIQTEEVVYTASGDELQTSSPAWSRDGSQIAFPSRDGFVHMFDIQNYTELLALDANVEGGSPVVWSPDGTMLVTAGIQIVNVWDGKTGEKIFEFEFDLGGPGYNTLGALAWSSDNHQIVGLAALSSHRWVWDIVSGQSQDIQDTQDISSIGFTPSSVAWSPDGSKLLFAGDAFGGKEVFQILNTQSLEELSQLKNPRSYYGRQTWLFWLSNSDMFVFAGINSLQVRNFRNEMIDSIEDYTHLPYCD